jgi:triosephosphate isomerase
MKKLIAGNWKMNGSLAANDALVRELVRGLDGNAGCTVAVCVPAPYLAQVQALRAGTPLELGAQDVSEQAEGAYTGEVSAAMLKEFGVRYVIIGHSERRQYHGETDAVVADKTKAALAAGITPIVCVGETLVQRAAGRTVRIAGAAHVPMQSATALAAMPVKTLARSWSAEEPAKACA